MGSVIVFGTFDIFHKGHESFFRQAKKRGDYLIVVVARDAHVKKAKGKNSKNNEKLRSRNVRKSKIPNKVILGSKIHNFYQTLRTHNINTIALGYDQKPRATELKKQLKRHRLSKIKVVRLRPYRPHIFKSRLLLQ